MFNPIHNTWSDAAREAAAAARRARSQSSGLKARDRDIAKAGDHSDTAERATEKAGKTGKASDHLDAAEAHRKAWEAHGKPKTGDNYEAAHHHYQAMREHEQTAREQGKLKGKGTHDNPINIPRSAIVKNWSDASRAAAAEARRKGGPDPIAASHAAETASRGVKADTPEEASAQHARARDLHQQAADLHRGSQKIYHTKKAEEHHEMSERLAHPGVLGRIGWKLGKHLGTHNQGVSMPLTAQQRNQMIEQLVSNCECWQGDGADVLANMSDERLSSLYDYFERQSQAVQVANTAVTGFQDQHGNAYRINPETGEWEGRQVSNATRSHASPMDDPDDDYGDDDDDMDDDEDYAPRRNPRMEHNSYGGNSSRARTLEELTRNADPELQGRLAELAQLEMEQKGQLIQQITVNTPAAERRAHYEWLQTKDLGELRRMLSLNPRPVVEDPQTAPAQPTRNTAKPAVPAKRNPWDDGDMLNLPTINWNEEGKGTQAPPQTHVPSGDMSVMTDDDYIRNAPPQVKAMLQNAAAIETSEKRKYVDQLVANIMDEDMERRARATFGAKSLDELKLLVAALGPSRGTPTSRGYFGPIASVPASTQGPTTNVNEDVLPLPTMNWSQLPDDEDEKPKRKRRMG